ncbi:nitric oxide reductase transcriptional regulator NorR [Sulfidibacter corallicola]|uniref:Nitric oxide reductase transcriptional regulator NorR n=1 Tax=Sulfidibacter corallicola TaxID=2818388 RepID=A0A8A4TIN1_SULCO|nr:nitric oxide reductase transcriptional regulator NorR [Sulfidibacter corallicola]QTD48648.1 nitric oxide reductase transcriptional regulator NorR [Sulfidibacter corallicola]
MNQIDVLLTIALDLNRSMRATDRYRALLEAIAALIPYDAACLLTLHGRQLRPRAAIGLHAKALARRYEIGDHPRLAIISQAADPVLFAADSPLPDPFDHLIGDEGHSPGDVHSCLGCPLTLDGEVVGVLTADALEPGRFDDLDRHLLALLGALAGSVLQTAHLMEQLEEKHRHQTDLAHELWRTDQRRSGGLLVGDSPPMQKLRQEIEWVANTDLAVLVTGETGVGKELVARAIHAQSLRGRQPMIYVNCAALPESLVESELFGHRKGAFTGADNDRMGKFELAHKGTLFLDEVGELPLATQPKLLRALQEGEIQRVGSDTSVTVDVRIIAATNRDLVTEVEAGRFRSDLFHRLNVYPIPVPALRDHCEDIGELVPRFVAQDKRQMGIREVTIKDELIEALKRASWPGNVRELRNAVMRGLLRAVRERPGSPVLEPRHVRLDPVAGATLEPEKEPSLNLRDATEGFQRQLIRQAVARADGNWAKAAQRLGVHRSNLHHLAKRLGLK